MAATAILPTEADYFLRLSNASVVITNRNSIESTLSKHIEADFRVIYINRDADRAVTRCEDQPHLDVMGGLEGQKAGVLLFTSGTTGSPKGVLHSSKSFYIGIKNLLKAFDLTQKDLLIAYSSIYWIGGLAFVLSTLVAGGCIEECGSLFNPGWFWERVRKGDVTYICTAPPLLDALAKYYAEKIKHGPPDQRAEMIEGLCRIRVMIVGSEFTSLEAFEIWQELRKGRPLVHLYGSTETHLSACTSWQRTEPIPAVGITCQEAMQSA
ncbi:MAG: hypothetical protein LQ351_001628 [Letrouitia transgressa]|nr:MAG: hypothetical protein LQ351_001628 [Letrouitia transgressa]